MKTIALLFCLLGCWPVLLAQPNCYEKIRGDGLRFIQQGRFGEAIVQFTTAISTCPDLPPKNDLDLLIQRAQAASIAKLEAAVQQANEYADAERAAKTRAEAAEQKALESKNLAEEKGREALEQGRRAEALRLSMLADDLRQKGQKSDALLLAFLSCRLAGDSLAALPALQRAFAEAVRDSMSEAVFSGSSPLRSMRWLPGGGRRAVAQLADGSAHFLDLEKKKNRPLAPPSAPAAGLAVSEKGDRILTFPPDGPAQLWDGEGRPVATLAGHSEAIRAAAFSPDGKAVATGSRDNTARLWSAADGAAMAVLLGHAGNVYGVLFAPGSDWLLTRSSDGTAKTWDFSGKNIAMLASGCTYVNGCAIDPFGKIALATATGGLQVFEANGNLVLNKNTLPGNAGVAFFGKNLLVGNGRGGTELRDESGNPLAAIMADFLVASPDGSRLVGWKLGSSEIGVWGSDGLLRSQFSMPQKMPEHGSWSPDGSLLLLTMADGSAFLTDVVGNIRTEWLADGSGFTMPGLFSPDGRSILMAGAGGALIVQAPEPGGIFKKMQGGFDPGSAGIKRVVAAHDVRFAVFGNSR